MGFRLLRVVFACIKFGQENFRQRTKSPIYVPLSEMCKAKEPSEHWSDAQIANYVVRASAAGPDGTSGEKHLEGCPSCRRRVLRRKWTGKQAAGSIRNERAGNWDPEAAPPAGPAEGQDQSAEPPSRSAGCPGEERLRELAAGLCPEPMAKELLEHASACNRCGPLLQACLEDFSDEFSPEESAQLEQTKSALSDWQRQTARKILRESGS